ncbi:Zinc finger, RING/FYVE/PHD-type [Metarhizium album ARSEF 1941]|uniref:Zinc finger, RING/FYVE/PHD-type n=1 Tax=Metarhizium album (strain ARSEF 1941) TaxID=1081103 RepID=A0A0B2X8F4_METAS|nr:Zinc finger, RING/FYVE/PHD-type [Metarhizium album ARSEF 1941]KHO01790.1 Zinc finger, RING/FYVE/PHD-type [Metarhizium album ARSEF 1941]
MDSFFSLLNRISDSGTATPHNNPHATPTLPDMANIFRLLQDQMQTLASTAPTAENRSFLMDLVDALDQDILDPPDQLRGVSQEFLDSLDRVSRKKLRKDDDCAICKIPYLEDPYCLVVELPCKGAHQFDLECVGPWLRSKGTCPMCREEVGRQKPAVVQDDDEGDDMDMIYA